MRARDVLAPLALAILVGCNKPNAMGEASSLIIFAADSLWDQVEDATYQTLEPTIYTVRDEKMYEVSFVSGSDPTANELKLFRNVLVFGTPDDTMLQKVAEAGRVELPETTAPRVFEVENVWAIGQLVTGVLLRPGREAEDWVESLPSVLSAVDASYREWVHRRMFATPPDSTLADELARRFGFRMIVPELYRRVARGVEGADSLVILRNDNPDPSELIRSILVQSRPKVDSLTAALATAWRESVDSTQYNVPQGIDLSHSTTTRFSVHGAPAIEVTGAWHDEVGNFPAGGPFMVWVVDCPARTYFIDAWLYAPNEPKYEYLLQLEEILGSFECA